MNSQLKKFMAVGLASTVIASGGAAGFSQSGDLSGHWAEKVISEWISQGLAKGYGDNSFRPDNTITRAEFVALIDNVVKFKSANAAGFSDVKSGQWYADAVTRANAAGVIAGDNGRFNPGKTITKQEAAVILAKNFYIEVGEMRAQKELKDYSKIDKWAQNHVEALYGNGYVSGYNGNFNPKAGLTRAEAIQMIDKLKGQLVDKAGEYTQDINGNVTITAAGAVFKNMTITGNVYVTNGIGTGEVTFDNVKIKGNLIASGIDEKSVKLIGTEITGKKVIGLGEVALIDPELNPGAPVLPPAVTPPSVGGGGGGGNSGGGIPDVTKYAALSGVSVVVNGLGVDGNVYGTSSTISLSGKDDAARLSRIELKAQNADCLSLKIKLDSDQSALLKDFGIDCNKEIGIEKGVGCMNVPDMLGLTKTDVSLGALRLLGDSVKLEGTLKGSNGCKDQDVSLVIYLN